MNEKNTKKDVSLLGEDFEGSFKSMSVVGHGPSKSGGALWQKFFLAAGLGKPRKFLEFQRILTRRTRWHDAC